MQITIAQLTEAFSNERIDSQFFQPEYVMSHEIVSKSKFSKLSDIAHISDGNHLKIAESFDRENGIRYLRGQDLSTDMILHDRNKVYIPESCFNSLKRSHIFQDDILITIVGANTGLIGLVFDSPDKLVANCKLGIARPNKNEITSGYLYAFLISQYGQHQILRSIRGGGQTGLVLPDMRKLRISRFDSIFEWKINEMVLAGHKGIVDSKEILKDAQKIILSEIGLLNWQPKHQLSFVKKYSDTERSERIDAEYYQPKYEEIENEIKNYQGGYSFIHEEFKQNKSTFKIDKNKIYQYVEIGSVNVSTGEISPNRILGNDLPANAKRKFAKDDVIVSKVRTYRGAISIVENDGYVGSGAFTILHEKGQINKETLLIFLHSKPLLAWSLKPNTGTSYPVITDDDILNLPIPIFPKDIQQKIQKKVVKSFDLRIQSKALLENVKCAVEIAVEKDETTAMKWLNAQIDESLLNHKSSEDES